MTTTVTAIKLFGILFLLTGLIYPCAVLLIAMNAFPEASHGSLITNDNGTVIGSLLIGQNFTLPRYFQGRPSATPGSAYNASASGGSNLGPTNPVLVGQVASRAQTLQQQHGIVGPIPSDLVMSSGSGLDPHISLEAALLQVPIIAQERSVPEEDLRNLVLAETTWNPAPFGQPYVNVMRLNIALDRNYGRSR
ncbi:MAG: potassium-transporting ATPase subunit KdpC [Methanomicrobiales archaeon]|nr:potassium-transporting ATPase subunit KdpC [Methanomicrobiales archaeon]